MNFYLISLQTLVILLKVMLKRFYFVETCRVVKNKGEKNSISFEIEINLNFNLPFSKYKSHHQSISFL